MVDFGSIKSFFVGPPAAAAAPPAASATAPKPAAPAATAASADSFTTGSDPGRALRNFTNPMDTLESAAKKAGEAIKPHLPESVQKAAEGLGKRAEANKNDPDNEFNKWVAPKAAAVDKWAKENIPGLAKALEPRPQPPPPAPIDLGDL